MFDLVHSLIFNLVKLKDHLIFTILSLAFEYFKPEQFFSLLLIIIKIIQGYFHFFVRAIMISLILQFIKFILANKRP